MSASNARRRRRVRSSAEQMYWDQLSPQERVAFTIGYAVGQGADFPTPDQINVLRGRVGLEVAERKPPATATREYPRARRAGKYDLDIVAEAARTAVRRGESPAEAVLAATGCTSHASASMLISKARKLGYDIPYVNRRDVAVRRRWAL